MAVIVNEFEMVPAAPPVPAPAAAGDSAGHEGAKAMSPEKAREIVRVVAHEWRRHARVRAD